MSKNKRKASLNTNPELKEFFEEVNNRKEEIEKLEIEEEVKEEIVKKKEKKNPNVKNIILVIALICSFIYYIISVNSAFNHLNYIKEIINATGILFILFTVFISIVGSKTLKNVFGTTSGVLIILLVGFNMLLTTNTIKLPTLQVLKNFSNTSLVDAMKWANLNNIEISTSYEYSDNVKEGYIISQDVSEGTILKQVKKIQLLVSDGPNYDKEIILSSLVGLKLDDVLNTIEEKHLNNVIINYIDSDDIEKDTVISQDIKGQIKRNEKITFYISLGVKDALPPIKIEDLTNKSEFDASLYLKRNGIYFKTITEYSDTIKRGYIISQDIKVGNEVKPFSETVSLVVSKGKEITIPDLTNKTVNDIINWSSENNLKLAFNEEYSLTIPSGDLIRINYNTGDIIEEETKIIITSSKGSLVFPKLSTYSEFVAWCNNNEVTYRQENQFNDSIKKGNIIKFSKNAGDKIDPNSDSIVAYVSYGSPVVIPNFVGQSKTSIQSTCKSKGLNCTFTYSGYSSTPKDIAVSQNVGAGNKVVSGSYISLSLSRGPAETFNIYIQSEWYGSSYNETVASLKEKLATLAPGVNFTFTGAAHNTVVAGMIHPDSQVQGGNNNFTQGKTYNILIVK